MRLRKSRPRQWPAEQACGRADVKTTLNYDKPLISSPSARHQGVLAALLSAVNDRVSPLGLIKPCRRHGK